MKKLNSEKRIAVGLLVHQLCKWRGLICVDAERVCYQPTQVFGSQRAELDVLYPCGGFNRFQRAHKRMRGRDLIIPVGADQQHVPHIRMSQQVLKQIERGRVEPLQIVEEERQGMFRSGKYSQEAAENELVASLSVLKRQLGDRTLLSDDEFQLRDQVHH